MPKNYLYVVGVGDHVLKDDNEFYVEIHYQIDLLTLWGNTYSLEIT